MTPLFDDCECMAEGQVDVNTPLPQSVVTNMPLSERIGPSLHPRPDTLMTPLFDDSGNLYCFLTIYKLFELLCLFLPIVLLIHVSLTTIDDDEGDIFEEDEGYLFAGHGMCAKDQIEIKSSIASSKLLCL